MTPLHKFCRTLVTIKRRLSESLNMQDTLQANILDEVCDISDNETIHNEDYQCLCHLFLLFWLLFTYYYVFLIDILLGNDNYGAKKFTFYLNIKLLIKCLKCVYERDVTFLVIQLLSKSSFFRNNNYFS